MNINLIINFVADVIGTLAEWLNSHKKELAWRPVRVDNRFDRY